MDTMGQTNNSSLLRYWHLFYALSNVTWCGRGDGSRAAGTPAGGEDTSPRERNRRRPRNLAKLFPPSPAAMSAFFEANSQIKFFLTVVRGTASFSLIADL